MNQRSEPDYREAHAMSDQRRDYQRIADLEIMILGRDARIAELEAELQSRVDEAQAYAMKTETEIIPRIAELEAKLAEDERMFTDDRMTIAVLAEREACHDIALAIDSGRGNEKEIARAIRARPTP